MPRQVGYRFPILDSANNVTTTSVDMGDMFVEKDAFLNSGLYAWGQNVFGKLGLNDQVHRSSPVQVGSLTNWKKITTGQNQSFSVKTDGTLWAWGHNTEGVLGLNDLVHRSSPVQVGSLADWDQVTTSLYTRTVFSIKYNGTLWTWGSTSNSGNMGLGDITSRSSPTQIGSLTNWKQVSTGSQSTHSVKTDGTLWAWGGNTLGQLGLSDVVHRSSPVQIGSLNNWKQVESGANSPIAIKTDGTLWAWGHNDFGQLGVGDIVHRSSPVQVGSLNNWKQISGSFVRASVKTDGTLWTWGRNDFGQLGLSDVVHRSSPVQVGSLTNWKQVFVGAESVTAAIKTDGTLWIWGFNGTGHLGLNDTVHRSSPVQVGSLTNWKLVSSGTGSLAIVSGDFYTYT